MDAESRSWIKRLQRTVGKFKSLKPASLSSSLTSSPVATAFGCYAICIDHLGPIQVPNFFQPCHSQQQTTRLEIVVYCSIFDRGELCFVGRTWKSNVFAATLQQQASPPPIQNYWFYVKAAPSESKWIVVELVAQTRSAGVVTSQISLGWSVLRLFENIRALIDVHPSENHNDPLQRQSKPQSVYLWQGSPLHLLVSADTASIPETATKLSFRFFTFKKLSHLAHLLSNDCIAGGDNAIDGLGDALALPATPFDTDWAQLCRLQLTEFRISSPVIVLPDGFDTQMLQTLTAIRKESFGGSDDATCARIVARELSICCFNGRNIIAEPSMIQLQVDAHNHHVLAWHGEINMNVTANLHHNCWLLISFYVEIAWNDKPSSVQSPQYHHRICVGREVVSMTSAQLIVSGAQRTELTLAPQYSWIDDRPIFNNSNNNDNNSNSMRLSFRIRSGSGSGGDGDVGRDAAAVRQPISQTQPPPPPLPLSLTHHTSSFDYRNTPAAQQITHKDASRDRDNTRNEIHPSSTLAMLQESFAMSASHKLCPATHPRAPASTRHFSTAASSASVRSLRGGTFDISPFDAVPSRKHADIDIAHELLRLSPKRVFCIRCTALRIKLQHFLAAPIETIVIRLHFLGETCVSQPIVLRPSSHSSLGELRQSLMVDDQYETLTFDETCQFEFNISPPQIRHFLHFVHEKHAIFTVLNGDNMFQLGCARACLRDFLLQNNATVDDDDDVHSMHIPLSLTRIASSDSLSSCIETQANVAIANTRMCAAQLCVNVVHQAIELSDNAKLQYLAWSQNLVTNLCDADGSFCVHSLKLLQCEHDERVTTALSLTQHARVKHKLQSTISSSSDTRVSISNKWSIPIETHADVDDQAWQTRQADLASMLEFRDRSKQEMLHKLSEEQQLHVQASLGQLVFFQVSFLNPWNERKTFSIEIDDDGKSAAATHLHFVRNAKELSYLQATHRTSTSVQREMFEHEHDSMNAAIMANAGQRVYIPLKYQCCACDDDDKQTAKTSERILNVRIYDDADDKRGAVAQFRVCVELSAFEVDRVLDICAPRNSKYVGRFPLPLLRNVHATHEERIMTARCSSAEIAFEFDADNEHITFRCHVGESPHTRTFYLMIYNDRYAADLNEVWQVNIDSYFSENCHAMLGAVMHNDIHLPSSLAGVDMQHIRFQCDEAKTVHLTADDEHKVLNVQYAPSEVGKKLLRIHAMDASSSRHDALYSCLLTVHVEMPKINKSFVIYVDNACTDSVSTITRKLPFNNGYNQARCFELVSHDPAIIRVENPTLEIPAEKSMEFLLEVMAQNLTDHSKEVLLFVTEAGNLEQCLRVEVRKGKVTNL